MSRRQEQKKLYIRARDWHGTYNFVPSHTVLFTNWRPSFTIRWYLHVLGTLKSVFFQRLSVPLHVCVFVQQYFSPTIHKRSVFFLILVSFLICWSSCFSLATVCVYNTVEIICTERTWAIQGMGMRVQIGKRVSVMCTGPLYLCLRELSHNNM